MQLSDLTLVGFLCLGGIRCLSYVPQIIRIARDKNGASAISYTTWCTWTFAHLATALYAGFNLHDPYLAAVSCIYAVCCTVVVLLTAFKRAQLSYDFKHQLAIAHPTLATSPAELGIGPPWIANPLRPAIA